MKITFVGVVFIQIKGCDWNGALHSSVLRAQNLHLPLQVTDMQTGESYQNEFYHYFCEYLNFKKLEILSSDILISFNPQKIKKYIFI